MVVEPETGTDHCTVPVLASSAYSFSNVDATYTTPSVTAADETTPVPAAKVHTTAPVVASSAYSLPSSDPTYTMPSATVGDDVTGVVNVQLTTPVVAFAA